MSIKVRRSQWIFLIWPASLLLLLFLIWVSGYVYWQIRISRAVAELRRGSGKYVNTPFYADPELLRIGSRGFPRLVGEFEAAVDRGDEDQAFTFFCGIDDVFRGALEVTDAAAAASGSYAPARQRPSFEELKKACRDFRESWAEYREMFPPWWQWWDGHERRRYRKQPW